MENRQNTTEVALSKFMEGYHCAQSVVYAFADEEGLDKDMLLAISTGFGAGIARKQETCGAVTGAIIILGAKYGRREKDAKDKTEATYIDVQRFIDEFTKVKGTIKCAELLSGCDLTTESGQQLFKERNRADVCTGCIKLACNLLQKTIYEKNINPLHRQ